MPHTFFHLDKIEDIQVLRLQSADGTNRLIRGCVLALTAVIRELSRESRPLIITGNEKFFSAGADLNEIAELTGPAAYEFSTMGQALMDAIENFPTPVHAAISGFCMGGGLDLALACHRRVAAPNAVLGHRGAAMGLITGWGGTQRLPRLIGKARALQMFTAAEKLDASQAVRVGLVNAIAEDPVTEAARMLQGLRPQPPLVYGK